MKQTYVGRSPIITLLTFFALVLGSQWTFGQITYNFEAGNIDDFTNGCAHTRKITNVDNPLNTGNTSSKVLKYWRDGTDKNGDTYTGIGTSKTGRGFELNVDLNAGSTYTISYDIYSDTETALDVASDKFIGVQINDETACNIAPVSMANKHEAATTWKTYTETFTAQESNEIIWRFSKTDGFHYLDNVVLTETVAVTCISTQTLTTSCVAENALQIDTWTASIGFSDANNSYTISAVDDLGNTLTVDGGTLGTNTTGTITISGINEYRTATLTITDTDNNACSQTITIESPLCGEHYVFNSTNVNTNSENAFNLSSTGSATTSVPGENDAVFIPKDATESMDIRANTKYGILVIRNNTAGKAFSVNAGYNLVVSTYCEIDNKFTVKSTKDAFGSFVPPIAPNFRVGANANIFYARYVAESGTNDLIAPPLNGMTIDDLKSQNNGNYSIDYGNSKIMIGTYNNTTEGYDLFAVNATNVLETGKGYIMGRRKDSERDDPTNSAEDWYKAGISSDTYSASWRRNILFNGSIVNSDKDIILSKNTSSWNLIGNPYTAWISVSDFLGETGTGNIEQLESGYNAVYGYTGSDGDFEIYNNTSEALIAPGQAFFVSTSADNNTITFKESWRNEDISGAKGDDFNAARNNNTARRFKLELKNGENTFKTRFYFNDGMTTSVDPGYDAASYNAKSLDFSIYSTTSTSDLDMGILALPLESLENSSIPLGINAKSGQTYTISIGDIELDDNTEIILEDNLNNSWTNLSKGDYSSTLNQNISGTGRFFVHIQSSALGIAKENLNGLKFATKNKTVEIQGKLNANTSINVYDLKGRLVKSDKTNKSNTAYIVNLNSVKTGIYIIDVSTAFGRTSQKIILK